MTYEVQVVEGLTFRPHRQTIHGSPHNLSSFDETGVGNCYSACIASLLGADSIDEVPHIQHLRNVAEWLAGMELPWHDRRLAREWLRANHDLDLAQVKRETADALDVHYIVSVHSHRGPWTHAVIGHRGEVVFDPSGLDDYTLADEVDDVVEVITIPYEPDPPTLIAQWREEFPDEVAA